MIVRAILAAAALALPLAPLAVYGADVPTTGALPHGGSYVLYRDQTIPAAAVDLWFRAPGAGYDNGTPGLARLAATAAAASQLESGKSLYALVRGVGGQLSINVYPDIIGVSAIVPSTAARRTIAAMSSAFFAPAIDENALKTARRDVAVLAVARRYSSDDLLHDALFAQLFTSGPAHYPPLPDNINDLAKISLGEVTSFAKRAFRASNATMSLAGNVDPVWIDAVTSGSAGNPDAPFSSSVDRNPQDAQITGNVGGVGMAWTGPGIGDERAATAMDFIADYLFRDQTGVVSKAIAPASGNYVSGQFITLHDPGVMLVTIGGSTPEKERASVLDAVAALTKPMDAKTFEAARNAFIYHLAADTQEPLEQADNLGWYAVEGNPSYAPTDPTSSYWKQAATLDPAYIASIAQRYLAHPLVIQLNTAQAPKGSAT